MSSGSSVRFSAMKVSVGANSISQMRVSSAIGVRLTVKKWLTPDKRWIHHVGLTPDVKVTVPDNNPAGSDPALDTAVRLLTDGTASLGVATVLQRAA